VVGAANAPHVLHRSMQAYKAMEMPR
jgi:hypothetical protein